MHELVGRPIGVRTTSLTNLFGFQVAEYRTQEMVDICPPCEKQEIEALQVQRRRALLGLAVQEWHCLPGNMWDC